MSENALVCELAPPSTLEKQRKLWTFARELQNFSAVAEVVVGMNNVTAFLGFDEDFSALSREFAKCWKNITACTYPGREIDIPVFYGGRWGEDLFELARFHRLTPKQVVALHTRPRYTVYMIGFQPGFPYLGGLDPALHTPRRAEPRTEVKAGSVGIGGSQTGIYPFTSPGGWNLIGHTELKLFDKHKNPPTLLAAGDRIRFVAEHIEL